MEVQDVKSPRLSAAPEKTTPSEPHSQTGSSVPEGSSSESGVTVDVHGRNLPSINLVSSLNEVIATTNVAEKAFREIQGLVKGIGGILQLVEEGRLPEQRVAILENEANQLVQAVRESVRASAPNGVRPLAGDTIKAEWEEQLGKSLEIILPDVSKDTLGLGQVKLTTPEFIVNTRLSVLRSQERLQELKSSLDDAAERIRGAATEIDIASLNAEASNPNLRDVESALSFAGATGALIGENPAEALDSLGRLDVKALGLLRAE